MKHLFCLLLIPMALAQDPQSREAELAQAVANVNAVFEGAWPGVVDLMAQRLEGSIGEMDSGDMVRKLRISKLELSSPPKMSFVPCPGDCQRLRLAIPGDGRWSLEVSGEIIPPWQRNKDRWRKLRLRLKDLSLSQDYTVITEVDGRMRLEPVGMPEMTFRLTSPNLLYRTILATAQRFVGDSLQESLSEELMAEMPIAELALTHLGGLELQNAVADLRDRLSPEPEFVFEEANTDEMEGVRWVPLDKPFSERPPIPEQDAEAFSVGFVEKDLDFYAPSFTAEVAVRIPEGTVLEDVRFRLGDREIARLTAPPWRIEVQPDDEAQVLFATATLSDGIQEDDYLYIEGRGHIEEMTVDYVRVPVNFPPGTFDEKAIATMTAADFRLREDDQPQGILDLQPARDRRLELVIALDMSYSMEGERLNRARTAAAQFVRRMFRDGDGVRILAYGSKMALSPRHTDLRQIDRALRSLKRAKGSSRTLDALAHAVASSDDDEALHVVLLITDGWNATGEISLNHLKRRLHEANTLVYTVGIDVRRDHHAGYGKDFTPVARPDLVHLQDLYDLAMITGGRPFFVDQPEWLRQAFTELEEELRSQLTIGYVSNQSPNKKGWREIEVDYLPRDVPLSHKTRYWKK